MRATRALLALLALLPPPWTRHVFEGRWTGASWPVWRAIGLRSGNGRPGKSVARSGTRRSGQAERGTRDSEQSSFRRLPSRGPRDAAASKIASPRGAEERGTGAADQAPGLRYARFPDKHAELSSSFQRDSRPISPALESGERGRPRRRPLRIPLEHDFASSNLVQGSRGAATSHSRLDRISEIVRVGASPEGPHGAKEPSPKRERTSRPRKAPLVLTAARRAARDAEKHVDRSARGWPKGGRRGGERGGPRRATSALASPRPVATVAGARAEYSIEKENPICHSTSAARGNSPREPPASMGFRSIRAQPRRPRLGPSSGIITGECTGGGVRIAVRGEENSGEAARPWKVEEGAPRPSSRSSSPAGLRRSLRRGGALLRGQSAPGREGWSSAKTAKRSVEFSISRRPRKKKINATPPGDLGRRQRHDRQKNIPGGKVHSPSPPRDPLPLLRLSPSPPPPTPATPRPSPTPAARAPAAALALALALALTTVSGQSSGIICRVEKKCALGPRTSHLFRPLSASSESASVVDSAARERFGRALDSISR
ncbi:hypothetical protein KM043_007304 [Ampulex compressa]|nr:hypothetical protein KM043_007304 [Ampulex compressa]